MVNINGTSTTYTASTTIKDKTLTNNTQTINHYIDTSLLSQLKYCNFLNYIILTCTKIEPIVLEFNPTAIIGTRFTKRLISEYQNFYMPKSDFTKDSVNWTNYNQYGTLKFSRATGQCEVNSSWGFFNDSMIGMHIYDGQANKPKSIFKITSVNNSTMAKGFWIFAAAEQLSALNNEVNWTHNANPFFLKNFIENSWGYSNSIYTPSIFKGYPACCCFFQERLFFAGSAGEPQNIWGSRVGDYFNFESSTGEEDDAMNLTISTTDYNRILALGENRGLTIFTDTAEYYIPENTNISTIVKIGTLGCNEECQPYAFGIYMLFLVGRGLNHLGYNQPGTYYNTQLSALFTQDNNKLLVNPRKIATKINQSTGNYLLILNGDGSLVRGAFMLTQEGKKLAVSLIRGGANYNENGTGQGAGGGGNRAIGTGIWNNQLKFVDIVSVGNEFYAVTDKFETVRIVDDLYGDNNNSNILLDLSSSLFLPTPQTRIYGNFNPEYKYTIREIDGNKLLFSGLSVYTETIINPDSTESQRFYIETPQALVGNIEYGLSFDSIATTNNINMGNNTIGGLVRVANVDASVGNDTTSLSINNKVVKKNSMNLIRCPNASNYSREQKVVLRNVNYVSPVFVKSIECSVGGGESVEIRKKPIVSILCH